MTLYLIEEIDSDKEKITLIYSIISITAPILGVVVGGVVINKLGGYEK